MRRTSRTSGQEKEFHSQVKTFNGLAQVLLQSTKEAGNATLTVESEGLEPMTYAVSCIRVNYNIKKE